LDTFEGQNQKGWKGVFAAQNQTEQVDWDYDEDSRMSCTLLIHWHWHLKDREGGRTPCQVDSFGACQTIWPAAPF
jgi:hypothetical protein